ncbi:RNase H domain-containing protein [Trichoderma simmonsii]|uniref:ribonuclease H n=1 Tax=Trichoderma simmonsii TaxID=1491479 RepID=A0A8G0LKF6_9HYPO|nr:RNase H domain-containing protein [Trichoderma simmonsii]
MRLRPQPCANIIANGISAARSEFGPETISSRRRFGCVVRLAVTVTRLRSSPFRARTAAPSLSLAREYYDLAPGSSVFRFGLTTYTTLKTMGSNNKRPASTSAAAPSLSKKRKTDNMQKYYAVQAGFVPGVYLTYSECQAQTAGFKGAIFKSFISRDDAEAFAAGKKVAVADEPAKFYAVAVGNPTGIFTDWAEASKSITGIKGPKYKRFGTRAEAVAYIRQYGNREAIEALGEKVVEPVKKVEVEEEPVTIKKFTPIQEVATNKPAEDVLDVWTDGSSLANGTAGSRAGLGVYFGDKDPRNLAERLPGEPQTNQRAELMAMQRALEIAPLEQHVQIHSDSQYSIKCVTEWAVGWKRKNWLTANGEKVKNQDIIRAVLDKIDERNKAGGRTYFQWVKGHATNVGNIAADRLAVRGANLP